MLSADRVRVRELLQRLALAAKPRGEHLVGGELGMQDLERDELSRWQMQRAVDRPEATLRDLRVDAKPAIELHAATS